MKTTLKEFLLKHHHEIVNIKIEYPKVAGIAEPKDTYYFEDYAISHQNCNVYLSKDYNNQTFKLFLADAALLGFECLHEEPLFFGAELEIEYNGFGSYQTLTAERTTFTFYKLTPCYD